MVLVLAVSTVVGPAGTAIGVDALLEPSMHDQPSSISEQALDLVDGLQSLLDVAFAHDLAVAFVDLGTHETALQVTGAMSLLVATLHHEVERVETLGELGALMGTLRPIVAALYDLLLEAGYSLGQLAAAAVARTWRPLELSLSHLDVAGRMGTRRPVPIEDRTALFLIFEGLIANLASFRELLHVLDPRDPTVEASVAAPK